MAKGTTALARLAVFLTCNSAGFRKEIDKAGKKTTMFSKKAQKDFAKITKVVITATTAMAALAGREMVRAADQMTNLRNRMFALTESSKKTAIAMRDIVAIASVTRSDIKATGDIYTKMAIATKDMAISQEDLAMATATVNNSFILSGTSAYEAANSARQLAQGLAAGRLSGDELRSVLENNTVLAGMLAEGFDVTRGELKEMGAQGLLTADKIMPILTAGFDTTTKSVSTMNYTVGQASTQVVNSFIEMADEINKNMGFTGVIAEGMLYLSENMKDFAQETIRWIVIPAIVALGVALVGLFNIMMANPIYAILAGLVVAFRGIYYVIEKNWVPIVNFLHKSFTVTLPNAIDYLGLGLQKLQKFLEDGFNEILGPIVDLLNDFRDVYNKAATLMDSIEPIAEKFSFHIDTTKTKAEIDRLKKTINDRLAGYTPLKDVLSLDTLTPPVAPDAIPSVAATPSGFGDPNEEVGEATLAKGHGDAEKRAEDQVKWEGWIKDARMDNYQSSIDLLGKFAKEGSAAAKIAIVLQTAMNVANILMSTKVAGMKAMAELGSIAGPPMVLKIEAQGMAAAGFAAAAGAGALAGQFHDGIDNVPSTGSYLLESGERVVDKRLNRDMTQFLAEQNGAGGNTTNNNPVLNFNVQGGDAENVEQMLNTHRGKFEGMIRDIYNESAQNAPF